MSKYRQIVDEHDQYICNKYEEDVDFSRDIYRVSCLWLQNSRKEILIAQRALHKNHGGLWSPSVAGTVEYDETYLDNIIKETEEEIGLKDIDFREGPKLFVDSKRRHFTQYFFGTV